MSAIRAIHPRHFRFAIRMQISLVEGEAQFNGFSAIEGKDRII